MDLERPEGLWADYWSQSGLFQSASRESVQSGNWLWDHLGVCAWGRGGWSIPAGEVPGFEPSCHVCVSVPVLLCAEVSPSSQSGVTSLRASTCECPTGKTGIQGLTLGRMSESSAGGIPTVHVYIYFFINEPSSRSARVRGINPFTLCVTMRAAFSVCFGLCCQLCVYVHAHSVHVCLLGTCSAFLLGGPGDS